MVRGAARLAPSPADRWLEQEDREEGEEEDREEQQPPTLQAHPPDPTGGVVKPHPDRGQGPGLGLGDSLFAVRGAEDSHGWAPLPP